MAEVRQSLEVDVPVHAAYDQWSQIESFPIFMDSVKAVEQRPDGQVYFRARMQGHDRSWVARIVKREADREIRWVTEKGTKNNGRVLFEPLDEDRTRVTLVLEYEPEDWRDRLGGLAGVVDNRVKADLERFKNFIERKERREQPGRRR